ncbi:MAG: BrnT family toxin [Parvularculaceae bacterium]
MRFTYDEAKREEIWEERGIDLLRVARMFDQQDSVEIHEDTRKDYGEKRFNAIGRVQDVWYELVYVVRDDTIHLVTAWKLNEKSKRKAQNRYARRTQRPGGER